MITFGRIFLFVEDFSWSVEHEIFAVQVLLLLHLYISTISYSKEPVPQQENNNCQQPVIFSLIIKQKKGPLSYSEDAP